MKKSFKDIYVGDILYVIDNDGHCLKAKIIEYRPNLGNDGIFIKIVSARGYESFVVNANYNYYYINENATLFVNASDVEEEIVRQIEKLNKQLDTYKFSLSTLK